jgi:hypothetical protein
MLASLSDSGTDVCATYEDHDCGFVAFSRCLAVCVGRLQISVAVALDVVSRKQLSRRRK